MPGTMIRFEYGQQDRMSADLGPYPYVQVTYADLYGGPDSTVQLASLREDGLWVTPDGQVWSDYVIWGV